MCEASSSSIHYITSSSSYYYDQLLWLWRGRQGNVNQGDGSRLGPPRPPSPPPPRAGLRINDMFHGSAVLHRDATVTIWGLSSDKSVAVSLADGSDAAAPMSLSATVNASSVWPVWVPPQKAAYNCTLTISDESGSTSVMASLKQCYAWTKATWACR